MKVLLSLACFIIPLISLEADKCKEREEYIIFLASANEIDVRACPLNPNENKGTIIWYKNDSTTPISTAQDDRIHQQKNKLWFVPAKVEDSGHYYCVVRNSTYCLKIKITTSILENEPDLCYNSQVIFTQRLHIAEDGKLVCPHLDFFKDENEELPQVQWYKDCKPLLLDNSLFIGVKNQLIVKNVSEYHRGHYTCLVSYTYLGKQYNITRVIEFFTLEEIKPHRPVILSPVNETKEVNLGSHVQLICNATGKSSDIVSWKWNGSEIFFIDDPVLEEDYQFVENPSDKIKNTLITILNISEVKSQFYLYPFICVARNTDKISEAYIQFVYPASDEKSYDAYILYPKTFTEGSTSNSDMFVFKILPEVLENQFGYRLFIYGRDDYVGEDTIEVTNENIKKSRRLIIVLVRDVSGFSWLDHSSEEQIVMYNALIEDGIKIVLLELEKIEDYEKMPESIRFIKQKHGTIRWSGDLREGPQSSKSRFWKKVRYHMPAQRRLPSSKQQLLSLTSGSGTKASLQSEVHLPLG
ncbi:PREDICTED: interleukin-1 receptor type 1 isoform X2 [Dipodomys ordii]|uniref:Interleukin-1 receptor type 1 n=1 Tax=Dipodomys ordii TaxID=10020 RepID=A0A1S3FGV6_DIPOR|nr:PREDICTED: interleukin-1 receptor type 1 isoform X2 [Dipodomys ordii]